MKRNVMILAEEKEGKLRNVSLEILAVARRIAGEGKVTALLFAAKKPDYAEELGRYGADEVWVGINPLLQSYNPEGYTQALVSFFKEGNPDVIIMGHTAIGRDVAPKVAARLNMGLISDVTGIVEEGETIQFIRPIYAGKAFQKRIFTSEKWMLTLRPNNFPPRAPEEKNVPVREAEVEVKDLKTIVKEVVRKTKGSIDLTEAKIIVSGGRGVKSAEGFKPLYELASVLGAAVGATRGACDAGYCDYSLQIGQTGKVVTPDLYIACGLSGAIQHLAGMSNSKVIVAINKDPEAPIFQVADYGIVGDLFEVVPLLTQELKTVLGK
ncbi:electron transfer flavoprotein (alpha subunit) [[Clostridium] ultunense Esp]|nr:electron transfer flavoprotein (alpha subunit) [[Clostridium] ultunense Esp]